MRLQSGENSSHVPSPVILGHVSQSRVDTTLRRDGMTTRGEELGDTCGLETALSCKVSDLVPPKDQIEWRIIEIVKDLPRPKAARRPAPPAPLIWSATTRAFPCWGSYRFLELTQLQRRTWIISTAPHF